MQSKDFKQWIIWNAGGGAAVLAVLFILILSVGGDMSSRAGKIRMQRQDLEVRLQSFNSLISLRAGADRAGRLLPQLQNSLPSKDQLISFSKYLETQAKQNNLTFLFSFDSETPSTDSVPGINGFSMTLNGAYADYVRFLKSVEGGKYFINFGSMDISEKGNRFEILIKGKVFSR